LLASLEAHHILHVSRIRVNPDKNNAVSLTKARVKEQIRYYFEEQLIPSTLAE
jgi:hypothetical protein